MEFTPQNGSGPDHVPQAACGGKIITEDYDIKEVSILFIENH